MSVTWWLWFRCRYHQQHAARKSVITTSSRPRSWSRSSNYSSEWWQVCRWDRRPVPSQYHVLHVLPAWHRGSPCSTQDSSSVHHAAHSPARRPQTLRVRRKRVDGVRAWWSAGGLSSTNCLRADTHQVPDWCSQRSAVVCRPRSEQQWWRWWGTMYTSQYQGFSLIYTCLVIILSFHWFDLFLPKCIKFHFFYSLSSTFVDWYSTYFFALRVFSLKGSDSMSWKFHVMKMIGEKHQIIFLPQLTFSCLCWLMISELCHMVCVE